MRQNIFPVLLASLLLLGTGCASSGQTVAVPPSKPANLSVVATGSTTQETAKPSYCVSPRSPGIPVGDVLAIAKKERASSFAAIDAAGASVLSLDGGKTYGVWWAPSGFDPKTGTVFVSLHGHGEFAAKGFEVWLPEMKEQNMAFLGIQWWLGRSLESSGYYEPQNIAALVDEGLTQESVTSSNVILEGFSMGSARSYGITMWDRLCGPSRVAVTISNAGAWDDSYPMYADMLDGTYGTQPLAGKPFVLFCGEKEIGALAKGSCAQMETTRTRIESLGANVIELITDPNGDHGSMNQNPENAERAIAAAKTALAN